MEQYYKKQLNEGYNEKLNQLFDEWKSSYTSVEQDLFCEDGLVVKYKDESSGYDINKEWHNAERKIMFIVKDCPNGWGYDTRRLLVGYENNDKSQKNALKTRTLKGRTCFFKNIASLLYGLWYMTEDNKGEELNNKIDYDRSSITQVFNDIPFSYVEAKKLAGGKSCSSAALNKALNRDGVFLAKEIDILRPNIIVCCDQNGDIFNGVIKNYFQGQIPCEDDIWEYKYPFEDGTVSDFICKLYYYKNEGVLLFQSYHPTKLGKEKWKIREKVLSPFRQFFAKYKTFDVVSSAAQK